MNRKHMARALEVKLASTEKGTFEGYGSIFGNVDSYLDICVKGCFTRSLAEHKAAGTMPAMLWQHDSTQPIGVWTAIEEDDNGLRVEGKLADTTLGTDVAKLLKMGALKGLSIGYCTRKASFDEKTGVRSLLDVDLFEISPVTFPANDMANIDAVKTAIESPTEFERLLRDAGFSRTQAKALMAGGYKALRDPRDADGSDGRQEEPDRAAQAQALVETIQKLTAAFAAK